MEVELETAEELQRVAKEPPRNQPNCHWQGHPMSGVCCQRASEEQTVQTCSPLPQSWSYGSCMVTTLQVLVCSLSNTSTKCDYNLS
ncbi:hypothetical protein SLE2022_327710 [Rubroshorea leprosula]